MEIEVYPFTNNPERTHYEFYSVGPKGTIKKVVRFHKLDGAEHGLFNLVFGDWDSEQLSIDDVAISNNADRERVLGTVAAIVLHFMEGNKGVSVLAIGSTFARTRLYQMGISKTYNEVTAYLIEGYCENVWQPFQKGKNFDAFRIRSI